MRCTAYTNVGVHRIPVKSGGPTCPQDTGFAGSGTGQKPWRWQMPKDRRGEHAAVGARLDVVPMALYKHVTNKSDLLDGMVEILIASYDPPDPTLGWKAAVRPDPRRGGYRWTIPGHGRSSRPAPRARRRYSATWTACRARSSKAVHPGSHPPRDARARSPDLGFSPRPSTTPTHCNRRPIPPRAKPMVQAVQQTSPVHRDDRARRRRR